VFTQGLFSPPFFGVFDAAKRRLGFSGKKPPHLRPLEPPAVLGVLLPDQEIWFFLGPMN